MSPDKKMRLVRRGGAIWVHYKAGPPPVVTSVHLGGDYMEVTESARKEPKVWASIVRAVERHEKATP